MEQSNQETSLNLLRPRVPGIFLFLTIIFLLSGSVWVIIFEKGRMVEILNGVHTPVLDQLFLHLTSLGSGWMLLLMAIFFLFLEYRWVVILAFMAVCQGVLVFIFKILLFPEMPRPLGYFDEGVLHIIEGMTPIYQRSFPSGHTMTAFGLGYLLATYKPSPMVQVIAFTYALLIAVSRIYLSLHFLLDTMVGAMLGSLIAYISVKLIYDSEYFAASRFDYSLRSKKSLFGS